MAKTNMKNMTSQRTRSSVTDVAIMEADSKLIYNDSALPNI